MTYAEAGVDIDAGNAMVEAIKPLVRATRRPGADAEIGGFGGLFDLKAAGFKDAILVAANDGVGTKVKIAIETGRHATIGIDLVAMCVNDIIVQGAEPLFFLDYTPPASWCGGRRRHRQGHRRGLPPGRLRADRRRDRRDAGALRRVRLRPRRLLGRRRRARGALAVAGIAPGDVVLACPPRACTRTGSRWCAGSWRPQVSATTRPRRSRKASASARRCWSRPGSTSSRCWRR